MATLGKSIRAGIAAFLFATLAWGDVPYSSAELKAVFLFNFGTFVQWPNASVQDQKQPFRIGVYGDPEVASALEKVVAGEKIQGRPVMVASLHESADAGKCAIVYVGAGQESEVKVGEVTSRGVLTVGDTDRFESEGGVVRFLPGRNRIRLRINVRAAGKAGLHINSQLLRIAETPLQP